MRSASISAIAVTASAWPTPWPRSASPGVEVDHGATALVDPERLPDEPLDARGRRVEAREPGGHLSDVGQRGDLHRELAAGGDELVERRHGNELLEG
jgi:hypothetical protein